MSDLFRFPDYAWLVETLEFGQFLDLAFTNDSGEVWLFNNDLQMFKEEALFEALYVERIAGRLQKNVTAVKVLVHPDLVDASLGLEASLKLVPKFVSHLGWLAGLPDGTDRLATFYFGIAEPKAFDGGPVTDGTWAFYVRRTSLDSGIAMFRQSSFPFAVPGDSRRYANVWMLQHYPELGRRLKGTFASCFAATGSFQQMEVTSVQPFDFRLVTPSDHPKPAAFPPLSVSLGDQVDVAIIAALPEEMAQFTAALGKNRPRRIPLHENRYEYVVLDAHTGPKRVLLTTISDQGTIAAAVRTWDVIHWWRPKHIILVGVAGGNPENGLQDLGDVVIGNWVVGYERGKLKDGEFTMDLMTYRADDALLRHATFLKHGGGWPRHISIAKPSTASDRDRPCHVHDDLAIASGNKLVLDAAFFKDLTARASRKIEAVEMEADGVAYACERADIGVKVLVIKGIMDKSDPGRDQMNGDPTKAKELKKEWMNYAARAAAEFAIGVVRAI